MSERLSSSDTFLKKKGPGILERMALIAGLAVAPKATASEQISRPDMTHIDPSAADQTTIDGLRRQIARASPNLAAETSTPQVETARISSEQVGRDAVHSLLSDGDTQGFLASPGDAVEFSAQALDDILMYRDSHLARLPTLEARRASRRQANDAIVREVQHRIDDVLSGAHGGTVQQRQELAVALSTAFSMMFDENHRVLHTYSLEDGVFLDSEPVRFTPAPGAARDALDAEPRVDADSPEEGPAMDPATDDPEDYEEDPEEPMPLDPNTAQR